MSNSWVEPAAPVQASIVKCSALDNLTASVYPSPTHFFPMKPETDPRQLYEDCKKGLSRCIYELPHLAGIIRKDETGRCAIEIQEAPHAGTNFWYRDHRHDPDVPSYNELKINGWPFGDGEQDGLDKLRPRDFPCVQDGDPIIAPQFNVIKGGIVLAMSITHVIGDLVQFMDFLRSWSQNTSAIATARLDGQPVPPLPQQISADLMDRSLLTPEVGIEEDLDKLGARAAKLHHLDMLDPRCPEEVAEKLSTLFTKARLTNDDLVRFTEDELRTLSCSVWTFSQSSIKQLQNMIQEVLPSGSKVSATDCLTSFSWNRLFGAKYAPGAPSRDPLPETSKIVFAGSIRHRLTPPLPNNYMPACVDLFPVSVNTSDFISPGPKTLAHAAMAIRNSNNTWSEETFREMLEIAHSHPVNPGLIPKGPIDALVTDHTRATAAMLSSWGPELGSCEAFREPYLGRIPPHGEITLLPRWTNGDVEVMFAGEAVVMERLRSDRLMNQMATCQFVMGDPRFQATRGKYVSKL
ncbi:acetyltransferase [Fusarium bulbicola]|nr:acetyltransferase [Fusarium bulbicola]